MRRLGLLVALAVGIAMSPALPAGAASPQRLVDVVVVMKSQANLGAFRAASRPARLAAVERGLRAHAGQTQQSVLTLLAKRHAQGLATGIVPLWIANEVAVRTTPAVVRELSKRPDVREVRPEFTVEAPTSEVAAAATSTVEPNVSQRTRAVGPGVPRPGRRRREHGYGRRRDPSRSRRQVERRPEQLVRPQWAASDHTD